MSTDSDVSRYLESLDGAARPMIDALRAIVRTGAPDAVETIKWNAPSFAVDGEDRITLGLDRKGGARLVLHRGAKRHATRAPTDVDPDGIARWLASDRGVVLFPDLGSIRQREPELSALCSRWVEAAA